MSANMSDTEKALDIQKKIERERALLNAANLMRQQTTNEAVRSKLDTQMREGRRNLEFFEEKLRELQLRRGVEGMNISGGNRTSGYGPGSDAPPAPPPKDSSGGYDHAPYGHGHSKSVGGGGEVFYNNPNPPMPKGRPNFTKLGMTRSPPNAFGHPFAPCQTLTLGGLQISSNMTRLISVPASS